MKMVQKPRKSLVAFAIASAIGGAAFMSMPAHAVNISPDGLGQVQIFPYYTVRNGHDTYIHLTNTSDRTVAVKIRFREAKNSREVRDFNIVLSPYDIWTAGVTADGDGAKLVTFDKSCTSPRLNDAGNGATEVSFTSIGYDGSTSDYYYDNGGRGIERTQEGYFEVIAMGQSSASGMEASSSNVVEYNAKHVNGVPRDCGKVDEAFNGAYGSELSSKAEFADWEPAGNVLKGFATLINVDSGQAAGIEPTTLANFNNVATNLFPPGDLSPDLNSGTPNGVANLVKDTGDAVVTFLPAVPGNRVDAVSALLMRNNLINEFTSTSTGSTKTDWVVTFPTKHNYTDDGGKDATVYTPRLPFDEAFATDPEDLTKHNGKSCVEVSLNQYDREERTASPSGTQFSPRSAAGRNELCNEVNVLSFNGSNVLGSGVKYDINTSGVGLTGWMNLTLGTASSEGTLAANATTTSGVSITSMSGLPVIGFGLVMRYNAAEAGNNRNYGVAESHSYKRVMTVAP